ncbi:hypothetical protein ACSDR0_45840 [Streptosporangium sp. G11]|uniref:hypothetical protein n=1 Tax=Streptosporangium sp. G11 TaxID=3436926 RepID=UPI003EC025F0
MSDSVQPEVRAAAFRALAAMPTIKSVGTVEDVLGRSGEGLRMSSPGLDLSVIIDPVTSQVLASSYRSSNEDKTAYKEGTRTVRVAEWTDELPEVVSRPEPGPAQG